MGMFFKMDELVKRQSGIEPGSSELIEVKGSFNSWVSTIFFDNRDLWKKCFCTITTFSTNALIMLLHT